MLSLSRKEGEAISIADGLIRVTIMEVRGKRVKLSIDAPKDIDVVREKAAQPTPEKERA